MAKLKLFLKWHSETVSRLPESEKTHVTNNDGTAISKNSEYAFVSQSRKRGGCDGPGSKVLEVDYLKEYGLSQQKKHKPSETQTNEPKVDEFRQRKNSDVPRLGSEQIIGLPALLSTLPSNLNLSIEENKFLTEMLKHPIGKLEFGLAIHERPKVLSKTFFKKYLAALVDKGVLISLDYRYALGPFSNTMKELQQLLLEKDIELNKIKMAGLAGLAKSIDEYKQSSQEGLVVFNFSSFSKASKDFMEQMGMSWEEKDVQKGLNVLVEKGLLSVTDSRRDPTYTLDLMQKKL